MRTPKYIWWVSDGNGGLGSWLTRKDAEAFIRSGFLPVKDGTKWSPVKHEVTLCPTCGKPAEKDIVEGIGECLSCDHVRGDVMDDMIYNTENEEE
jgi:hypothetical protein